MTCEHTAHFTTPTDIVTCTAPTYDRFSSCNFEALCTAPTYDRFSSCNFGALCTAPTYDSFSSCNFEALCTAPTYDRFSSCNFEAPCTAPTYDRFSSCNFEAPCTAPTYDRFSSCNFEAPCTAPTYNRLINSCNFEAHEGIKLFDITRKDVYEQIGSYEQVLNPDMLKILANLAETSQKIYEVVQTYELISGYECVHYSQMMEGSKTEMPYEQMSHGYECVPYDQTMEEMFGSKYEQISRYAHVHYNRMMEVILNFGGKKELPYEQIPGHFRGNMEHSMNDCLVSEALINAYKDDRARLYEHTTTLQDQLPTPNVTHTNIFGLAAHVPAPEELRNNHQEEMNITCSGTFHSEGSGSDLIAGDEQLATKFTDDEHNRVW